MASELQADFYAAFEDQHEEDKLGRIGPKHGVTVSWDQIAEIVRRHLGASLQCVRYLKRGYNNRIFDVTTADGKGYVLKVCGRHWTKTKTETEVVALDLIRKFTQVPVPVVLGWCSDRSSMGVEYLLLDRIPGRPLDTVWPHLSRNLKEDVIGQLAGLVVDFKTSPSLNATLKEMGNLIGNFGVRQCADGLPSCEIIRCHEVGGPFRSFTDFYLQHLSEKIRMLKDDKDGFFVSHAKLLPRLERLVDSLGQPDSVFAKCQEDFVLDHGDLSTANVMVSLSGNGNAPVVTGILDWEWSGPHLPDEEFTCCDFLRKDGDTDRDESDPALEDLFFGILQRGGVLTPRTIPNMAQRKFLAMVKENVAPWYLTDVADKNSEQVKMWIEEAEQALCEGLDGLGF